MSSKYEVRPISKAVADRIVAAKHYRRTLGIFWEGFGLFDDADEIVGVVCYGQPSAPIQRHAFESRDFRLYEMTRLVIDSGTLNGASILIGRSLQMLSVKPSAIISYADSGMGHVGIVYQATNWVYTGAVKAHDSLYKVGNEVLHPTTVRDRYGVTNPTEWAKTNGVERVPPQPKHRYFQFVGNRRDRAKMKSLLKYPEVCKYPKAQRSLYDAGSMKCQDLLSGQAPVNLDLWGAA